MSRIYLIRHGECSSGKTYVGEGTDLPLNQEGREQMSQLGHTLCSEGIKPTRIITSSLNRAKKSGQIIATSLNYPLPLEEDSRLNEINFGQWEGLTFPEITTQYPKEAKKWVRHPWRQSPPGGENSAHLAQRVKRFYASLRELGNDETVLILGHGGSMRMLLCLFLGLSPKKQWSFKFDRATMAGIELVEGTAVLFHLG